jgi:hypothetical protein
MSGRLGGEVKIVILPNKDHDPNNPQQSNTHQLYFTQANPAPSKPATEPVVPFSRDANPPAEGPPWDDQPRPAAKYPARSVSRIPVDRGRKPPPRGPRTQLPEDSIPWME